MCSHRYAECQLNNMSIKQNKYVVNLKLEQFDVINVNMLLIELTLFEIAIDSNKNIFPSFSFCNIFS